MNAKITEALRGAAGIIAERGHAKGMLEDTDGRVCAIGALRIACFGTARNRGRYDQGFDWDLYDDIYSHLESYIHDELCVDGVMLYNDEPERTQAEVVAAFRAAAEWEPSA